MESSPKVEMESKYYDDYLKAINVKMNQNWNIHGIHHRHLNRFIQNQVLALPSGSKVLDGGCGLSIWLTPEIESKIEYSGLDCQKDAVDFCQNKYSRRKYYFSDLYKTPFNDRTFDMIVMREVIEHATDPEKLLRECKRILKPEGFLVLTTPNYDNPLLFLVENIYNRFFSTFKPYLADVHPSKFGKRRLNETIGKHFVNVNVGTIDLGINLTAVARSSSS